MRTMTHFLPLTAGKQKTENQQVSEPIAQAVSFGLCRIDNCLFLPKGKGFRPTGFPVNG